MIWGLLLRMRRKGSSRRASASLPPRVRYVLNSCTNLATDWERRPSMRFMSSTSHAASASKAGPCQSCGYGNTQDLGAVSSHQQSDIQNTCGHKFT